MAGFGDSVKPVGQDIVSYLCCGCAPGGLSHGRQYVRTTLGMTGKRRSMTSLTGWPP